MIAGQVKKKKGLELERLDNAASENQISFIEDGGLAGAQCPLRLPELNTEA